MRSWTFDRWLGIIGAILGVAGLVFGYYWYDQSREERDLVFIADGNRTEIISASRVNIAPIKVLDKDGTPVETDVHAVQFYLWNAGKRPIKQDNVLTPLTISLSPESTILDYKVIRTSRSVVGAHLTTDNTSPLRRLGIAFRILEQNDGFVGQIIYQGGGDVQLTISGLIESDPTIRTKASAGIWDFLSTNYLLLLGIGIATAFNVWLNYGALSSNSWSYKLAFLAITSVVPIALLISVALKYHTALVRADVAKISEIPEPLRPPFSIIGVRGNAEGKAEVVGEPR